MVDLAIEVLDPYLFDPIYKNVPRLFDPTWIPPPRSNQWREFLSTYLVLWWGGSLLYLVCGVLSWVFLFDKKLRKDKFFLPNQEYQEIKVALSTVFIMALPQAVVFYVESTLGYSRLHVKPIVGWSGWLMLLGNCVFYILFTDCLIYWIHRWLHHPLLYGPIHKLHHKWIVSTPFASHAFHWLDGFLQGLPYHIYVLFFPMHKVVYVIFFIIVNFWTVSIHDGHGFYRGIILNGSDHHVIHHRQFTYNYGQYFTFWDRICGTHKAPEYPVEKKVD